MPVVGMKRSTRAFVPKTKDGPGVRVLRSGRRLRVESRETKIKLPEQRTDGRDLFRLIGRFDEAVADRGRGTEWPTEVGKGRRFDEVVLEDVEKVDPQLQEKRDLGYDRSKMFGNVYFRKRKRVDLKNSNSSGPNCGDRMFRLHFTRRNRRRVERSSASIRRGDDRQSDLEGFLYVTVDSSCDVRSMFASVLSSVLRHMCTGKVELLKLSKFLQLQPLAGVFGSNGIHFLQNRPCNRKSGYCRIYETGGFMPLFDVDFWCVPLCFVNLHATMWFRSMQLSSLLLENNDRSDVDDFDLDDIIRCVRSWRTSIRSTFLSHDSNNILGDSKTINVPSLATRSPTRLGSYKNSVAARSCQRRRKRSLRTRRARNPLFLGVNKRSRSSVLDTPFMKNAVQLPNHEINKPAQKNSAEEIKVLKSTLLALGKDIDSLSCSANLLVVELDRCYREPGVHVMLELSTSNEWILAVRKDGSLRYFHKAPKGKEVKLSSINRYTCAIVWGVEAGWKLEFAERKDWAIFKELFKVCGDRNVAPPSPAKSIPIPGVCEVPACGISQDDAYVRPESYIRMSEDELARALLKRTPNYDMDSEDEKWLNTFKSKVDLENEASGSFTEETFELMIDAFEKAVFCGPDDLADEKVPENLCLDLARREVVEDVYSYWIRKRKQKRAPLIRVFQLNEHKKTPLPAKPVLRKKRSMKQRHGAAKAGPSGRGKEFRVLQAIAAKREANEEQSTMIQVEEARAAAKSTLEVAISKRRRAQALMANADLAMYRAAMALRIAEAAQAATDPDQTISLLLD